MDSSLTLDNIASFREAYQKDEKAKIVSNAVTSCGIGKALVDLSRNRKLPTVFSIDLDCGKVTNQKRSGRCWMFAGLNVLRKKLIDTLGIADIELSQAYLQFYDKLEKGNFFLEKILERSTEDIASRENVFLLDSALGDGGHWAMFVSLVRKYGIVPSYAMPDTAVSCDTGELNVLLSKVLKRDAFKLRECAKKKGTKEARKLKERMLSDYYRVLSVCLGLPPKDFVFEYRDKEKNFHREERMTPLAFYEKHIGTTLAEYVPLSHVPLAGWKKNVRYAAPLVNNVLGGEPVVFFATDMKTIKQGAIASLKENEPLWFAGDVGEQSLRKEGVLDASLYDYESVFGIDLLHDKGKRLDMRIAHCSHAMCLTGVNIDDEGKPDRWKVENSWGKENGFDGFYVMSDEWFTDNVFQVIVNRKYLPKKVVESYDGSKLVEVDPYNTLF